MQSENLHQKSAEEIMKEVDRESNVRVFSGWRAAALKYGKILAALFMTLYSEIGAKLLRAPAILLIVPCCIPIVPGSYLYYTGYSLLSRQTDQLWFYAKGTLQICLGIAVGMGVASMLMSLYFFFLRKGKKKRA